MNIQADLAQRCIELLSFEDGEPKFILDIGCGSGISGQELTDGGHFWIGIDISRDMLSSETVDQMLRENGSPKESFWSATLAKASTSEAGSSTEPSACQSSSGCATKTRPHMSHGSA